MSFFEPFPGQKDYQKKKLKEYFAELLADIDYFKLRLWILTFA